ncbi:Ig-like domain repeat protein [Rhizobium skierniewicense]|uniref:Ig-like domain repeat protein n=1 Tax=Rhizobium skierniewicense TaxID=984260 RepID=UPI001FADB2FD
MANSVNPLTVTPTASNGGSIKINGATATSAQGYPVALNPGPNNIEIEVTAADNVTKQTYSLTVTRAAAPPTVTNISPSTGKTAGETSVTITGTDFTGATSVTIGGELATNVDVESATEITATTPANGVGAVDVVVTTPAGNGTLSNGFTYTKSTPNLTVSAPNPSPVLGESVAFTATLSNVFSPSGTVTFKDGTNTIGTGTISGTTATYTTAGLTVGSHSITAEYGGDTNNAPATSAAIAVTVAIGQAAPTVVVSASDNNPDVGESVTFTATLSNGSSPSGTVTFKNGTNTIGTGTISNSISGTTATYTTTSLTAGSHSITAEYGGDTNNAAATSAVIAVTVAQSAPTIVVSASDNNPDVGESVTFTATLSNGSSPSGTVTFKNGTNTLDTGNISSNIATYTTATLTAGSHSITAEYGGDTNNAPATSAAIAVTVAVGQAAPTVVVSASDNNPDVGESVTFTATLSNGSAPSGNVTFKDGTNTIGTGTISISISGTTATYTTTSLTAGSHSITAEYGGDTNNAAATSAAIAVTVAAPTFTFSPAGGALSSARVGSRYDQTVTANASGITAPISYSVKTGALPSGLTLNTASGEISGTPTTAGIYSFTIEATDNATPPNTGSATYALTVNPAATLVFSPAGGSLPEAMAGEEYSQPISATGGTGATTYRIPTGSPLLPAGLVLNVSTGELAGSLDANTEGDYSFTIEASDNTGATATASYTLHVAARAVTVDDKTVTVSAGSAPNNVNLAAGATGGPFDSAEIISNTQSNAGSFAIVNGEFAQASGPTPTGWYMKFIPNPAFSGRVSVGFRLTSTLGVSNTGTITYNIAYDPAEVACEIDTLVYGFVQTRQNLISSTIKVPGLLERRQMARATAPVATRMTPSAQGITLGFSTSLAQMKAARDNSDGIVSDEQLPFNVCIDGTFLAHNRKDNGDKWGNFAMVSAGADYLLSPRALIGLSFHFDHMTDPTEEDATLTGNGWFAGPNASLEIGKGIFWDTSLLYGGSANSIDTQFWDGSFDTTRWMFDTSISGQWNIDDVTTLTPKLRALYFSETAEDYSVTNSDGDVLTIEGFTQDQLRVSLGAELARQFTLENDNILTPKIGLTGGVTDRDSNRAFGQLSAGLSLDTASNWNIDAGLLYNFSADDEKSLGVKVGIGGKF